MARTQATTFDFLSTVFFRLGITVALLLTTTAARPQSAKTLAEVRKIYVEKFSEDDASGKLRERLIEQLGKNPKLEIVQSPNKADAILKGNGSVWIIGHVSTDPRSPANARQAIYRGFLSVEVVGKNNEPLWSYLVTPSRMRTGSITQDLTQQLAGKLAEAMRQRSAAAPVATATKETAEISLNAAGATFPAPLYQKWFESFQESDPSFHIKYSAVGSEAGIQLLASRSIDFAASDVPLSDQKMADSQSKVLHFPTVLGAVVPIYNLPGTEQILNFTPELLAQIYLGKIKKWNDSRIREWNKGARLPDAEISVLHRSDGSGTTFVWTDYLSKVSSEWKTSVGSGSTVNWPVGSGAEGNEAVAAKVQQTPNSIGYVELVYALRHQLSFGAVRNADGRFVQADLPSVTAAARNAASAMTSDFRVSITNAPGKGAYPISTFTWWLLPSPFTSSDKKTAFIELLQWALTSGQKDCASLGYAPLPQETANRELQFLNTLK